jgi:hypothetical protein
MRCTRSESTEIPWCEPLDEPDLMIGTILVNGHRMVLSTYVHMFGLGMVRNGTRKRYVPICPQTLTDISAKAQTDKEITTSQIRSYEHLAVQKFSRSLCMYKVKFC